MNPTNEMMEITVSEKTAAKLMLLKEIAALDAETRQLMAAAEDMATNPRVLPEHREWMAAWFEKFQASIVQQEAIGGTMPAMTGALRGLCDELKAKTAEIVQELRTLGIQIGPG